MAFWALSFVSEVVVLAFGVFAGSDYFEVVGVAAATVSTQVVKLHLFWDLLVAMVFP
jgi:hypothetical protein